MIDGGLPIVSLNKSYHSSRKEETLVVAQTTDMVET